MFGLVVRVARNGLMWKDGPPAYGPRWQIVLTGHAAHVLSAAISQIRDD